MVAYTLVFDTMCVSLVTHLPGCLCIRPVFIISDSLGPQQTSAVCSLLLKEPNSELLYPEELPSRLQLHRPYLDTESA